MQPLDTKCSSSRNVHVVSCDARGNMILAPGRRERNEALACLAFLPLTLSLCTYFRPARGIWIAAILFPLFTAGGYLAGHMINAAHGARVVMDPRKRSISVSGLQHPAGLEIPFEHVAAIQRLDAGIKGEESGSWHAYQINLVLKDQSRHNLLDSGGVKQLDRLGEQMARFLGVPFDKRDL